MAIRLKHELFRLGMSQAKLSHKADINQTSLSRIMLGKEPVYPNRAKRIADAIGWAGDPMELFEEVDDGNSE